VRRIATLTLAGFAALSLAGACSGRSNRSGGGGDDESAGEGGTTSGVGGTSAGVGGSSGENGGSTSGGSGGSGGKGGQAGGDAGSAPTGGVAGTTTTGGAGGAGQGGQGGGRECDTADDCVRFSDCCSCMGVPIGSTGPSCDLVCIQSACEAQQITPEDVTCSFGRCVIDRSCNHALATCDETPEPCPNGQVRTIEDGCFGGCLAPTECSGVTNCASCGSAVCVANSAIGSFACVDPGSSCDEGSYCDCLDACPLSDAFDCVEGDEAVNCYCLAC
jgi:hypothetical protein